jgi:hypothetical protein
MTADPDAAQWNFFHGFPREALPRLRAAAADHPRARWLTGAALGALGRYGDAKAQLTGVTESADPARYRSLAAATLASHHRQLGRHAEAAGWDEVAATLAGDDPEASFDARLGAAADAVGLNDVAGARAALERCEPRGEWRRQVRIGWVETEIALLGGDPAAAMTAARSGLTVAERAAAPRHVAKCLLFLGAALHVAGDPGATATLDRAAAAAGALDALPLHWVAEALLAERSDHSGDPDGARRHRSAAGSTAAAIGVNLPVTDRERWLGRSDIAAIVAVSAR